MTLTSRQTTVILSSLTLVLLGYFVWQEYQFTNGYIGAPLDDTWIHLQFARNLAAGAGFSYNPGQPTAGSTAPLWTVLLAVPAWFTTHPSILLPLTIGLSSLFYGLTAGLTTQLTREFTQKEPLALLAGVIVLWCGRFVWAGLSGMEVTLFSALTLVAVWFYQRWGWQWWLGVWLGVASQTRPEGHAFFLCFVAMEAWRYGLTSAENRPTVWQLARPVVMYTLVNLPYTLFCLSLTGYPLPNTFYAKANLENEFSWRFVRETAWLHGQDNPAVLLLAPLGLAWVVSQWRKPHPAGVLALWVLGLPLLMALTVNAVWHYGRYTLPLWPHLVLLAVCGLHWLWEKFKLPPAGYGVLALFLLAGGSWQLATWSTILNHSVREILEIDVRLGYWLAENTPAEAVIAVDDIGAIGFLSGRKLIDLNGLVSPELWPAVRLPERPQRNVELARLLSQTRPDYVVSFPLWRWEMITNPVAAVELFHVRTETQAIIFQQDAYVHQVNWPYVSHIPATAQPAGQILGEAIQLQGVEKGELTAGQPLTFTLYWQSVAPVTINYDIFIHLLNEQGEIVAQADQQPVAGLAPTAVWRPGDVVRDPYHLPLPAELPAGVYRLTAGMYDKSTGQRLKTAAGVDVLPLAEFVYPTP